MMQTRWLVVIAFGTAAAINAALIPFTSTTFRSLVFIPAAVIVGWLIGSHAKRHRR